MAKRKWLDADEKQAWIGMIATLTLLDVALDRQLQESSGLSHAQYAILSRLSDAPGRMLHMSALAAMTSSSQSRLSHAVSRLEDSGWERCPENGRAVHATLTDSGMALVRSAAPGHVAEVRRLLFDHLSKEQVLQLGSITESALQVLAKEGYETPLV